MEEEMKRLAKRMARGLAALLTWPLAALGLFGRVRGLYLIGVHTVALGPGLLGDYLRWAFYRWTLRACATECAISFGVILSNADAEIGEGVYIGPYSVLGRVTLGRNVQVASLVQILSGARQHSRDASGTLQSGERGEFQRVEIGADCWVGAAAIVMANVGAGSTVGAGAVVTKPVEPGVVVVGNPARVLKRLDGTTE